MFAPMMQYRDGRPNDPVERRLVQHSGNPFSGLTPDELRRRIDYERNNPVPMRAVSGPVPMRAVGETPKLPMLTDMRARSPIGSVTPARSLGGGAYTDRLARPNNLTPAPRPQPIQFDDPFTQQPVEEFKPLQLEVSGDNNSAEASRRGQFGQQPQFNQQGMQQMMQFMQQMMQMFSMMNGQGGRGGFGGGFNQRPPMFGGGFGGGFMNQRPYGGGFGQGGYQQPRQRPMPSYPRMQNNYSQDPFGGY